jgi:hypothetical protein
MWDIVGKVADVVSLVSVGLAGWTLWLVWSLRGRIVFDALSDNLVEEVNAVARWLADHYRDDGDGEQDVEVKFRQCLEKIAYHEPALSADTRKLVKKPRELAGAYQKLRAGERSMADVKDAPSRQQRCYEILSEVTIEFRVLASQWAYVVSARKIGGADDS